MGYGRTDATDGRVFPWVFPLMVNYWSLSTAKIKYIAELEGGLDKLKGLSNNLLDEEITNKFNKYINTTTHVNPGKSM